MATPATSTGGPQEAASLSLTEVKAMKGGIPSEFRTRPHIEEDLLGDSFDSCRGEWHRVCMILGITVLESATALHTAAASVCV